MSRELISNYCWRCKSDFDLDAGGIYKCPECGSEDLVVLSYRGECPYCGRFHEDMVSGETCLGCYNILKEEDLRS